MATILITGVGGACGIGATQTLQNHTAHDVVGVDMDPRAAGLYLAEEGHVVPAAGDDSWAEEIRSLVLDHDVDAVIPTVDEELAHLSSLVETLPADVPIVAPRLEVINISLDKYRTNKYLERAGHSVPRTWLATATEEVDESAYPLLIKPRRGRGSRGITRVESEAVLDAHLQESNYDPEELLIQEHIEGTEYTTSVVATSDNQLLSIVPKEAIEKQGSTITGVTRKAPSVADSCRAIYETLVPHGPLNIQQIVSENGVPLTIEINPRFSSTSCLTAAAGVDEFDLLVRDFLGESVNPPDEFESDLYIQRYDDQVFIPSNTFATSSMGSQ